MTPENEAKLILTGVGVAGTLLGTLIGGFIAWRIARSTQNLQKRIAADNLHAQERVVLDGLVVKMLEFLMQHPHLEKDEFCQSYPLMTGHPNGKERYEAYCIFVFNMLARAFRHFDNDPAKLCDYIGLEEIVGCHHKWWFHDKQNFGYDEPFRMCIQAVYDQMRRENKIK